MAKGLVPTVKIRPVIFVCSPLRGDTELNIDRALRYSRFVFVKGGIPLAPHTIFTRFLDDEIPEERKAGMEMGLRLMRNCDELWAFGKKITKGMAQEIEWAKRLGLPVIRFDTKCSLLEEGGGKDEQPTKS